MEAVSHEQFKIQHLKQRIAVLTVEHEDTMADKAVELQLAVQKVEEWQGHARTMAQQVQERDATIETLKALLEENGIEHGLPTEFPDPEPVEAEPEKPTPPAARKKAAKKTAPRKRG
jgi:hypothetical protein